MQYVYMYHGILYFQAIVPSINEKRNRKFHKLFRNIPEAEICIKGEGRMPVTYSNNSLLTQ